jgi:hypothetical protein
VAGLHQQQQEGPSADIPPTSGLTINDLERQDEEGRRERDLRFLQPQKVLHFMGAILICCLLFRMVASYVSTTSAPSYKIII